jgi:hypothetical protein
MGVPREGEAGDLPQEIDGEPDSFKDVRWKSFIRKYSEDEIGEGLEVSKKGEPFRLYGESRARKSPETDPPYLNAGLKTRIRLLRAVSIGRTQIGLRDPRAWQHDTAPSAPRIWRASG